ncbi:formate--tetrahydrofolate ligase [uncultured Dialister sp.]|jgi:formate--tetrahydrofolate ligase|uniref:formate--tetrahydrofolate ligase n=1 Tax=uncultured Dialister sp. TaxID=278064 RepID=UPI0025EE9579|nr:formate--tetrahydrofolate ligase [uncultured Dialister sp.]
MLSDIEIAQKAEMKPITEIGASIGIPAEDLENYGPYKAKLSLKFTKELEKKPMGHLILVTAISPTPAGEGKTTTTVGLGQALAQLGKKAMICLREPSLGPCMGIKGGAAGGGYSQVVPMEDINLHFTGDLHAITAAHNLLAAMVDNHIQQGNVLGIDPRRVVWNRVMDMNDRVLRHIVVGLGGHANGVPRESGFDITVASEVMAILCLATSIRDMKERFAKIIVGYTYDNKPVTAGDIHAQGAMAALMKDALKPNLVQTLEHVPAFIHGGPFANIAHGCNSILATKTALHLADYVVTEAGFGADLGAEKFLDIKCRFAGLKPDAAVLVATIRALKMNGGKAKNELTESDPEAVKRGLPNLLRHVTNLKKFGLPIVVALNMFPSDTAEEKKVIEDACREEGVPVAESTVFVDGGKGGLDLGRKVLEAIDKGSAYKPLYDLDLSLKDKIETIAKNIYGAANVQYDSAAEKELKHIEEMGFRNVPVCIAKTPVSFSDDPAKLGAPSGFTLHVREVKISAGAGFVVVLTGKVMTMPGLPKRPAAERIDVDDDGNITGLF